MIPVSDKVKLIVQIFTTFLKISPVTFGGGYAIIPLIEREVVQRKQWVNTEEMADVVAIAGAMPGTVAINSATFIGYRLGGITGAIAAILGILLPTFILMVSLSLFFLEIRHHPKVEAAFVSMRVTVVALITYAAIKYGKAAIAGRMSVVLIGLTVALLLFTQVHPFYLVIGGGAAGILLAGIREKRGIGHRPEQEQTEELMYFI